MCVCVCVCHVKTPIQGDPDYCGDCKRFFTDFKIKLTDKTEQVWCLFVRTAGLQVQLASLHSWNTFVSSEWMLWGD